MAHIQSDRLAEHISGRLFGSCEPVQHEYWVPFECWRTNYIFERIRLSRRRRQCACGYKPWRGHCRYNHPPQNFRVRAAFWCVCQVESPRLTCQSLCSVGRQHRCKLKYRGKYLWECQLRQHPTLPSWDSRPFDPRVGVPEIYPLHE